MGINFSYPNDAAIDAIGVLDKHDAALGRPPGWTRAVVEKIHSDIQSHVHNGREDLNGGYDPSKYTAEENAAWDFYQNEVIEQKHWEKLVKDYNEQAGKQENVKYSPFDPNQQYIPKNDSGFEPPTVSEYSGGKNSNHQLSVSTEALGHFAKELDEIAGNGSGMLFDAHNDLTKIEMHPGGFAKAELLRQSIGGAGPKDLGLRGDTMNLLLTVHETMYAVKQNVRSMVKKYESAEELNGLTAEKLNEAMGDAWSKIGNIKDYGNTNNTTSGGS